MNIVRHLHSAWHFEYLKQNPKQKKRVVVNRNSNETKE